MEWLSAVPAILASLLVLTAPGLIVTLSIGLRGLWAIALAPLVSTTLWVIAATISPWLGLGWTPLTAIPLVLTVAGIVVVLFRWVLRIRTGLWGLRTSSLPPTWATVLACAIGTIAIGAQVVLGVGSSSAVSQTYDNIFHMNLLAFTSETSNASALAGGHMVSPGSGIAFYPNAWHALVAIVQSMTGATIPVSLNAFNLVAATVVWSPGMLLLVRQFTGRSVTSIVSAGLLLALLPAMPLNLLHYGVLYPFFYGLILAPAALAVVSQLLGLSREGRIGTTVGLAMLLLGVMVGVAIAHPGAAMAVLALSVPLVVVAVVARWRSATTQGRLLLFAGTVSFVAMGLLLMVKLRPSFESAWAPQLTLSESLRQTLGLGLLGYGAPIALAILVLLGIVASMKRGSRTDIALVSMWGVGALLFFTAAWMPFWRLRVFTVGIWYADLPRLAAIYAVALIPLAAVGVSRGHSLLTRYFPLRRWLRATIALALLIALSWGAGLPRFLSDMRSSYTIGEDSPLLSLDERRLLERLPELVPENDIVVGNPWTGAAWALAIGQRDVLFPHVGILPEGNSAVIVRSLKEADEVGGVCVAINAERAYFVLDFGGREVHGGRHAYPGIEGLEDSNAVALVAREGEAKLYKVTACD